MGELQVGLHHLLAVIDTDGITTGNLSRRFSAYNRLLRIALLR